MYAHQSEGVIGSWSSRKREQRQWFQLGFRSYGRRPCGYRHHALLNAALSGHKSSQYYEEGVDSEYFPNFVRTVVSFRVFGVIVKKCVESTLNK